jgi:hypothetical protein
MEINLALLIYILIVIATFILARLYRIRSFSAFTLGLITGIVMLGILYPYPKAGRNMFQNKSVRRFSKGIILYALIQILTWVIIFWYVCNSIIYDRENIICECRIVE